MLRQDIERWLSHCYALGETDLRLLSEMAQNERPLKIKKLNSLSSFLQAVRLYLIDRLVSEYNFLYC